MASVFDIFGELNLEHKAFEGSLRSVEARLGATDKALDGVISKSNKLGDTSATVARRYEKLSESIQQQRNRLLDNALAFEKGEITAKQFANIVNSVDKATLSLNSKLKDAKARLTELNETNLTHFQQQIVKANTASTSLWKSLSGFQKTQLSFQLNDIITGLASGQSPFQILAQQGGQVVQILQQSKTAQEGVAVATTTAATAQAAFATSTTAAATSQAVVAAEAQATAVATEQAAAASTIMGASVVSLGAILAAGLVTILAVYKATLDIKKAAEDRLKNEEKITAEWNKQHGLIAQIKKELAEAAKERAFSSFVGGASLSDLNASRSNIFGQLEANQKKITDEMQRRQLLSAQDTRGLLPKDFVSRASEVGTLSPEKIKELSEDLKKVDAQIYAEKARLNADHNKNVIEGAMRTAEAARKADEQVAVEAAKKRKELVEKSIEDAKKFAEQVKKGIAEALSIVSGTSDNPFVKIFTEGEQAVQKMLEATKGLGAELQNNLRKLIESDTATKAFKQSMENSLKASGLRAEAAQFLGKPAQTVSENLQRQLNAIGGGSPFAQARDYAIGPNGALTEIARKADPNQRARDQKIIELTRGLINDEGLTPAQKQAAAAARIREAAAIDAEPVSAAQTQRELVEVLKKLKNGATVKIINKAKDKAEVTQTPTQDATNDFYDPN